jgi:hypothetical protein
MQTGPQAHKPIKGYKADPWDLSNKAYYKGSKHTIEPTSPWWAQILEPLQKKKKKWSLYKESKSLESLDPSKT